jgi:hypothetical protein
MKAEVVVRLKLLISDDAEGDPQTFARSLAAHGERALHKLHDAVVSGPVIAHQVEVTVEPDKHGRTAYNPPATVKIVEQFVADDVAVQEPTATPAVAFIRSP